VSSTNKYSPDKAVAVGPARTEFTGDVSFGHGFREAARDGHLGGLGNAEGMISAGMCWPRSLEMKMTRPQFSFISNAWKRLRIQIRDLRPQLRLCLRVTVAALVSFVLGKSLNSFRRPVGGVDSGCRDADERWWVLEGDD
jgi:hypothetical protein